MSFKSRIFTFTAAAIVAASLASGTARTASNEGLIKASFVFNFIKFIDWPDKAFATPDPPVNLCIWGNAPVAEAIGALGAKKAKNRDIDVQRLQNSKNIERCHVLFVAGASPTRLKALLGASHGKNILTISDVQDFAQRGGVIGLFLSGGKMRFAINRGAAEQSGLRISSQLLKLGKIVATARPSP